MAQDGEEEDDDGNAGGKKSRNKLTLDMKNHMLDDMWLHKE